MNSLPTLVAVLLLVAPVHATGFADGIKIGEVTATSAVVWVRLTERAEADRRIDKWDEMEPKQWSVPGGKGRPPAHRLGDGRR
jgi:phosphodiesterase/alkaline phosphatase D-like protein